MCWDCLGCIVSIYMCFLSSFRCRESGQTSESIVGAALIPNPQAIVPAFYVLTSKNKAVASKYLVHAHVHTRTDLSVPEYVLCVPVWALSVLTSLLVFFFYVTVWTRRCCKLRYWKNILVIMQDSYLDEKWQTPFWGFCRSNAQKENCSFCSNIRPEYWRQPGQNPLSKNRRLFLFLVQNSPFPGPVFISSIPVFVAVVPAVWHFPGKISS